MIKPIPLFWWNERILQHKEKENYGDLLSKYLVEKISGRKVKWIQPQKTPWYKFDKRNFLAAGSIIHHSNNHSIVWGSGIIDRVQPVASANFKAVRGPETRNYLLEAGYDCPEVYGDPAILLPLYYNPKQKKKYRLGIIPHYQDYDQIISLYGDEKDVLVIDLKTLDVEQVTFKILQCENIISSSLHGLIVSHAYGIPAIWIRFSDKLFGDNIKFTDYQKSVKIDEYKGKQFLGKKISRDDLLKKFNDYQSLPSSEVIKDLQQGLMRSCPFK